MRHDIQLPDSATEGTCLRAVRKVASDEEHRFFRRIVTAWSLCAYASRLIDEQTLARLCDDWPVYYEAHA